MMRSAAVLFVVCAMTLALPAIGLTADQPGKVVGKHKEVHAVVEKVEAGVVHLKEPGQMQPRTLSPTQLERMKLKDLKAGDDVSLIVDENNVIIDAHRAGVAGQGHQTLAGAFVGADAAGKKMTIKTPAGLKTLNVDSAAVSKLSTLKKGAMIKAEIDEAGAVIDVHAAK